MGDPYRQPVAAADAKVVIRGLNLPGEVLAASPVETHGDVLVSFQCRFRRYEKRAIPPQIALA